MVEGSARQDQRPGPDTGGEGEQPIEVTSPLVALCRGQGQVEVADVAVDAAHAQARRGHLLGHLFDAGGVEPEGDVVAHSRQGSEIDFGEPEFGDGGERVAQPEVTEADRRAAEPVVDHENSFEEAG